MIKSYHSKIHWVLMQLVIACNCNVNAMVNNQQSIVPSMPTQQPSSQQNGYLQNGFNGTLNMTSQYPFAFAGTNPALINSAVMTNNSSNQFTQTSSVSANSQSNTKQQLYSPQNSKRTCIEAMQSSLSKGISDNYCILDLSNTIDFSQSADLVTQQFFAQIQAKGIKYIYMDLYNSFVNDAYISKWSAQFKQAGMQVLWNLSGNKTVSDQTIVLLGSLDNVSGLNIAGTSVTDAGATQLVSMLSNVNPIYIDFINIYRTKISDIGRTMLETKFNENTNRWNASHPNKKINGRGIINDLGLKIDKKNSLVSLSATSTQAGISQPRMLTRPSWTNYLEQPSANSNMLSANVQTQQAPFEMNTVRTNTTNAISNTVTQPIDAVSNMNTTAISPSLNPGTNINSVSATTDGINSNIIPTVIATPDNSELNATLTANNIISAQTVEQPY